eukprot:scaffold85928_cov37-Tisochrysis_lutea.AAC.1
MFHLPASAGVAGGVSRVVEKTLLHKADRPLRRGLEVSGQACASCLRLRSVARHCEGPARRLSLCEVALGLSGSLGAWPLVVEGVLGLVGHGGHADLAGVVLSG